MKLLKLSILLLLCINLYAKQLNPNYSFNASGGVNDIVLSDDKLYVATTASSVDIFKLSTKELIKSIKIPKIKDFIGDIIDAKVYSVDIIKDKILLLSQGEKGGRNISIYEDDKLINIIPDTKRLFIERAKFLNENLIIYGLLSNEIVLYDIKNKKEIKKVQVSLSKFTTFGLSEDKSEVVIADESGEVSLLDTKTLKLKKVYKGQNVDNLFQVKIHKNIIATAGQDRRCAIYSRYNDFYKKAEFLIYSVGISPSAKRVGFMKNEQSDVEIFELSSKKTLYTLTQNPAIVTNILFLNENEVIVTCDQSKINYYKLD